jgi:hypothetical protein
MKKDKQLYILIIVFFCVSMYNVFGLSDMNLHIRIMEIRHAGSPEFLGSRIIFTYEDTRPVRYVGIIFDHEGFNTLHIFERNKYNIFFLVFTPPTEIKELKYRLNIDGLLTNDPANPDSDTNLIGVTFSRVAVPERFHVKKIVNPQEMPGENLAFSYEALPGKIISLVGDFNEWDPYSAILEEKSPGFYTITIRVSPGRHYYYFYIDGQKHLDPYNLSQMISTAGETVNSFITR